MAYTHVKELEIIKKKKKKRSCEKKIISPSAVRYTNRSFHYMENTCGQLSCCCRLISAIITGNGCSNYLQ